MARDDDVLIEGEGHTFRGLFVINLQGTLALDVLTRLPSRLTGSTCFAPYGVVVQIT
jgi:alkyl hydroperoxide reductase subunit AhpC